jgi:hypothetical protein
MLEQVLDATALIDEWIVHTMRDSASTAVFGVKESVDVREHRHR